MNIIPNTYLVISNLRDGRSMISEPYSSKEKAIEEAKFQIEKGHRALNSYVVLLDTTFESSEVITFKAIEKS